MSVGTSSIRVRDHIVAVLRKHATLPADAPPRTEFEVEVRLGVCATANGARARPGDVVRRFASNIGGTHFYATFEVLAARADGISVQQRSSHSHYAAAAVAPNVRSERNGHLAEFWTAKQTHERHDCPFSAWFDVRVALSEERRVEAPPAILEARQLGQRIRTPWQQPRTRLGVSRASSSLGARR